MSRSGNNVRLTEQAHALLAEKAVDYNATQKDIASEAILMLVKREGRERMLLAAVSRLEKKEQDNKLFAFSTFVLGAIASGCAMFFVGVL